MHSSDLRTSGGERCESSGRRTKRVVARMMKDAWVNLDENPTGIISGEWPKNFSLLSYDDLWAYLEMQIVNDALVPARLGGMMSMMIWVVIADQTLVEIDHHFEFVLGLLVVDQELRCIRVIFKGDKGRATDKISPSPNAKAYNSCQCQGYNLFLYPCQISPSPNAKAYDSGPAGGTACFCDCKRQCSLCFPKRSDK